MCWFFLHFLFPGLALSVVDSALRFAVPNITRNGLARVLQRSLQPAFDDQVCFVATVRLAKPQFIKVLFTKISDIYFEKHHFLRKMCNVFLPNCFSVLTLTGDVYGGGAQWRIHFQAQSGMEIPFLRPQVNVKVYFYVGNQAPSVAVVMHLA